MCKTVAFLVLVAIFVARVGHAAETDHSQKLLRAGKALAFTGVACAGLSVIAAIVGGLERLPTYGGIPLTQAQIDRRNAEFHGTMGTSVALGVLASAAVAIGVPLIKMGVASGDRAYLSASALPGGGAANLRIRF